MPLPSIPKPYIKFRLEGVVALRVKGGVPNFDAAIIKSLTGNGNIPNHKFSIQFEEFKDDQPTGQTTIFDEAKPVKELHLEIRNQTPKGAEFFHPSGSNVEDLLMHFDWVVGVEGKRMHNDRVGINRNALRTVLRVSGVDEGIFYTAKMSPADLKTEENPGDKQGIIKGTAEVVEAIIPLPVNGAKLSKLNEATGNYDTVPFPITYDAGVHYEVTVSQVCTSGDSCFPREVAKCYNDLITGDTSGRKISIVVDRPPISPQTQCIIENFENTSTLPNPA